MTFRVDEHIVGHHEMMKQRKGDKQTNSLTWNVSCNLKEIIVLVFVIVHYNALIKKRLISPTYVVAQLT